MSHDLIGGLILLCGILTAGILFIVVNIDYTPNDDKDSDDN